MVPTFHAMVVVDIESFGSRPNPVQATLRRVMYAVVRAACAGAGVDWGAVEALDRGDGIILLVPPPVSTVTLAGKFVQELDAGLAEEAARSSAGHRMRLRVALHQGNCARDETGWTGEAINTACRLVDADPLRSALKAAPEARMALIVSDEIYRGVVRHGYRFIDPASFGPAELDVKELSGERVWISVPGRPYPPGLPGGPPEQPAPAGKPPVDGAPPLDGKPAQARPQAHQPEPQSPRGSIVNLARTTVRGDQVAGDKTVYLRAADRDE